jgi:hypothetical protein
MLLLRYTFGPFDDACAFRQHHRFNPSLGVLNPFWVVFCRCSLVWFHCHRSVIWLGSLRLPFYFQNLLGSATSVLIFNLFGSGFTTVCASVHSGGFVFGPLDLFSGFRVLGASNSRLRCYFG